MAVTINEMHVDVKGAAPAAPPSAASSADPKKDVNLRQTLEIMQARNRRLRAD